MDTIDRNTIPRVILVFNGELGMSPGKMASQAFQACDRLYREIGRLNHGVKPEERSDEVSLLSQRFILWQKHTTTIARVAKTTAMFERVCAEVPGVVMVDEGFTEVDPDTPTVFASWPVLPTEEHKLLSNSKVTLLGERDPFTVWPDEWLQDASAALTAAAREGAFGNMELRDALRAESARRHVSLREPYASHANVAPEQWLSDPL